MIIRNVHSLILAFGALASIAQVDRSKLPEPSEPRPIEIGDYKSFELKNGLKVFVIENHKLPRVTYRLRFDRSPILEGDKVGYLGMFGQMLRTGTDTRTKEQLDEEIDFLGASLFGESSAVFASGLSKYQDKILELMTDVILNPTFPEEELEKIRTQTLSGLAASKEDPGAIAGNLNQKIVYGANHPYGEIQTEETTNNVVSDDLRAYHDTYFRPNVAYLAVVGDVDLKETKKRIKKYFSNWEAKDVSNLTYEMPATPKENQVNIVNRSSSVQSVINVTYPVKLEIGSADVIPVRVMNQVLGGGFSSKLNMNLREDKGYTYGSQSSIASNRLVSRFAASASVRNDVTDSSLVQIIYELNQMVAGNFSQEDLDLAKNSIAGSFARSLESPQTVARFALNTAIYNFPEDYYSGYIQRLQAVTLEDVKAIAAKYIKPDNAYINVVGKAGDIAEKLAAQFGEVNYFDTYGNEVDPSLTKLPGDLTTEKVLADYIKAIGGKEAVMALKNVKMSMTAEMSGQSIGVEITRVAPNKLYFEMSMGGSVMQKRVFDGEKGKSSGMGQEQAIEGEEAEEMVIEASLFPELVYAEMGVETTLTTVETIDGKEAYGVEVKLPSGKVTVRFYDAKSGLLVREVEEVEGAQGTMMLASDFGMYKEDGGVMFPTLIKQPIGPQMQLELTVNKIIVNGEVPENLFKQ